MTKKTRIPLLAALVLLTACNGFKTRHYEDDLVLPLAQDSPDSLFLSIDLEYAVGGLSEQALAQMNNTLLVQAFDLEDTPGTVEETAVRYRENLIDEYLGENSNPAPEGGVYTWEDRIMGQFTGDYKNWKNYLLSYYTFRGGAHGIQTLSQIVFDSQSGATIAESDLFADDYILPLSTLMQEAVRASMEAEDPELLDMVWMENIAPNGNFSVGKQGVEWVFQPYEAGPYALGVITAALSWEQLKPYLK